MQGHTGMCLVSDRVVGKNKLGYYRVFTGVQRKRYVFVSTCIGLIQGGQLRTLEQRGIKPVLCQILSQPMTVIM